MNATTPYEQLIAAKLDQVPVPDMADSIWASIGMQLDAPGGDSGGAADVPDETTSKAAPKFRGAGWYGLGLIAVVAITLWWYFSLPQRHEPLPVAPPAVAPPAVVPSNAPRPVAPPPAGSKPVGSEPAAPRPAVLPPVIKKGDSLRFDTAAKMILPPLKVDSSFLEKNKPELPDVDLYGPPPPSPGVQSPTRVQPPPGGKKHKGVKGITEDDYKISTNKDSARKRN
ncbi:MAG TPA: hypothetical protein VHC48_03080 [Puia sp.]|nr:hypothetical protein [Puia sp.]